MQSLDVGYDLGDVAGWTSFDRHMVVIEIASFLQEPGKAKRGKLIGEKRRQRVRLVLRTKALKRLKKLGAEARVDVMTQIRKEARRSTRKLARSRNATAYLKELRLDLSQKQKKDQTTQHLKRLLAVGLIVRVMMHKECSLSQAKNHICTTWEKNIYFTRNFDELEDAWAQFRNVASLAGAYLDWVFKGGAQKFDCLQLWESTDDLKAFLVRAKYYEELLLQRQEEVPQFDVSHLVRIPDRYGIRKESSVEALQMPSAVPTVEELHDRKESSAKKNRLKSQG